MSDKYVIPYNSIVWQLVPHFLRGTKLLNWLYTAVKPLQDLNDDFVIYKDSVAYFLQFDSRIRNLEKFLNEKFDAALARIYITNLKRNPEQFIYNFTDAPKDNQMTLYSVNDLSKTTYIYSSAETALFNNYDFTINVPTGVSTDEEIRINTTPYVIGGKTYTITRF